VTILPTIRHQLEQAAERKAASTGRLRLAPDARFPRRAPIHLGAVSSGLGVIVALGIALAAVMLLAHQVTRNSPQPLRHERTPVAAAESHRTVRLLLDGDGVGSVKFGQSPAVTATRLGRLFGAPVGAMQIPNGYQRFGCGFHWEIWRGVGGGSDGRLFIAQLTAWFRDARFVGYDYAVDNFATSHSNLTEHTTPRIMLATSWGLAVGDSLARGRRLYGRAFVVYTRAQGTPRNPRLPRLPFWRASTPTGLVEGAIGNTALIARPYGTAKRTVNVQQAIHSIDAGASPNTPCAGA
jgi:hypothetical protein